MPESVWTLAAEAWGPFIWLALPAFVAGIVRGFSGFGTAMIYLPAAGLVLPPFEALTTLVVMDLIGPLAAVPGAWRAAHRRDIARLVLGAVLAVPLGVWALGQVAPEVFRYGVSLVSLVLLVLLIAGVRYRRALSRWMVYLTGAIGGFLAGLVGLPGPPVIMLYMASPHGAAVVRANTFLYLLIIDYVILGVLFGFGHLVPSAVLLGLFLVLPYGAGNLLGAALFDERREKLYRGVAFALIAVSAVMGLPIWD